MKQTNRDAKLERRQKSHKDSLAPHPGKSPHVTAESFHRPGSRKK